MYVPREYGVPPSVCCKHLEKGYRLVSRSPQGWPLQIWLEEEMIAIRLRKGCNRTVGLLFPENSNGFQGPFSSTYVPTSARLVVGSSGTMVLSAGGDSDGIVSVLHYSRRVDTIVGYLLEIW